MKASDFPDLDNATFIKAPQAGPLDGIVFDGTQAQRLHRQLRDRPEGQRTALRRGADDSAIHLQE